MRDKYAPQPLTEPPAGAMPPLHTGAPRPRITAANDFDLYDREQAETELRAMEGTTTTTPATPEDIKRWEREKAAKNERATKDKLARATPEDEARFVALQSTDERLQAEYTNLAADYVAYTKVTDESLRNAFRDIGKLEREKSDLTEATTNALNELRADIAVLQTQRATPYVQTASMFLRSLLTRKVQLALVNLYGIIFNGLNGGSGWEQWIPNAIFAAVSMAYILIEGFGDAKERTPAPVILPPAPPATIQLTTPVADR